MKRLLRIFVYISSFFIAFIFGLIFEIFYVNPSKSLITPKVEGLKIEDAMKMAENVGLSIKIQDERYDISKDKGIIIKQSPNYGITIKKGQTIYVIVSKGIERITMPDLKGMNLSQAQKVIFENGLRLKRVSYTLSGYESGYILAQFPPPFLQIPKESDVSILMSNGYKKPLFVMPNVIGEDVERVNSFFMQYGINCVFTKEFEKDFKVVAHIPRKGFPVSRDMSITLEVSK